MEHSAEKDAPREALMEFFTEHRPIPCGIHSATERANWYACTCEQWESGRTRHRAEEYHIREFEGHMADVLIAAGWTRPIPPGTCPQGHDRRAGRWCETCGQHGSHHTDRHGDFACCAPPGVQP